MMLSKEDNELLTRVGPGTPMGNLLRHYWIPALISTELPDPDGPPLRVRLLGEDLIAFRDTAGRVGLLANHCSHRGASLFFGRNEDHGLRCVYHGWKYDVDGRCVDMPNEPAGRWTHSGGRDSIESSTSEAQAEARGKPFHQRIRHTAYPCLERGGIIWTYMGEQREPPPHPDLEYNLVPEAQVMLQKRVQRCNWVQALEGDIDQSHVGFLHSRTADHQPFTPEQAASYRSLEQYYKRIDRTPRYAVLDTPYGVMGCATRTDGSGAAYYRVSHFLMPFHTITPPGAEEDPSRSIRAWVPMDDDHVVVFGISYHPTRPFEPRAYERLKTGAGANWVGEDHMLPPTSEPEGRWRPQASKENDYFLDRELQRSGPYSGIPEFWAQDAAMQESMGPICDRSEEHLGTSDALIIRMRRRLIDAAKALQERGEVPPGVDAPDAYRVRGVQVVAPGSVTWLEATGKLVPVAPGANPSGAELGLLRDLPAGTPDSSRHRE